MFRDLAVPQEVVTLAQVLHSKGHQAFLVGGCTRDLLLGAAAKDWDLTTDATPEQIQAIFPDSFYENTFGTVGVKTRSENPTLAVVEITPYRLEGKYSNMRHPDEVTFSKNLSDDLKRRDFTVNAIAYNPLTKELVDEHEGLKDLENRVLRAVGDPEARFKEDALRTLRAIRFCAQLDFVIESGTMTAIAKDAHLLSHISKERIRDEFSKTLMTPRPMQALYIAEKLNVLGYIIPELKDAIGVSQNQAHAYDVFEHLLRSCQHAADKNWPFEVRLAALLHDIGKPATKRYSEEKRDCTFHGHEVVGARMTKKILNELKYPKEVIDVVTTLVRWHMFFSDPDQVTLSAVRRTIANVGQEHIKDLLNLRICDRVGTGRPKEQPFRLRKYMAMVDQALRDPISVGMLAIDGQKIMEISQEKPGPRIGWVLHALLEEALEDPSINTAEVLSEKALSLLALSDETLRERGLAGKERKNREEEAAIHELEKKHHVA